MKEFLQGFADNAKKLLQEDGYITSAMMRFRNEQLIISPQLFVDFKECNANEAKSRNVFAAGMFAKKLNADLIVFVWDAAFRTVDLKEHPNAKEEMDATETPLTYPRSMRTECIIINGIPLPDGKDEMIMVPYKGGEGEPVELLPDTYKGLDFESRFTELVRKGWNTVI